MLIVAALGGNALLRRGEPMTMERQRDNVRAAAVALAPLSRAGHRLIVTHGNGPQVGLLALQAARAGGDEVTPLYILDAESEGMIGYLVEQELANLLPPEQTVATILTRVRIDPEDPAFHRPDKPIGPRYERDESVRLRQDRGWTMIADGATWRRAVPSPLPLEIMEERAIRLLVTEGIVTICAGGGGIPVARQSDGRLVGMEAVVDKDRTSALLAQSMGADHLLLLTDVDAVYRDWNRPGQRAIAAAAADALDPRDFAAGSMRPKLEAALDFAQTTGRPATIGRLQDAGVMLEGKSGTRIDPAIAGVRVRHRA